jgi:hypothetical protein
MSDFTAKLQTLPADLKAKLSSFTLLPMAEKVAVRSQVLQSVISPSTALRVASVGIAYLVSTKYRFLSQKKQLEIAGALIGGHLGYYSVEAVKKSDLYIATPLEESLVAALGGMYGTELLLKFAGDVSSKSPVVQTYNLYVLLMHLLPVLLRTKFIREFDELYPVGTP